MNAFNGVASKGFQTNASSTWETVGIYQLATEQNLWGASDDLGLYGLDSMSLGSFQPGDNASLSSQTIAGVATADVWLGSLGLGTAVAKYTIGDHSIPSMLDSMKTQNFTPSLSFGYTAGASYCKDTNLLCTVLVTNGCAASPKTPGSLILGGYDQARFSPSNLSFPVGGESNQTLPLSIKSVIAQNVFGGTLSLLASGTPVVATVDSTVSQMWLPQSVCDLFAQAFGLNYDSSTGLYLVNNTIHSQLKQMNPSVTFAFGSNNSLDTDTTNIVLPYAAFDLQATIPLYNFSTNYFPLRVAANESQQVLGRAFLQEAYVFVEWERNNFTIGQAIHQNTTTQIVPVLSPSNRSNQQNQTSHLSTGVIVGIAVAAFAAVALAATLAVFLIVRSRRNRKAAETCTNDKKEEALPTELHHETLKPPEIMSVQVYELTEGENSKHEIGGPEASELQGESLEGELEGDGERLGTYGGQKKKRDVYELP